MLTTDPEILGPVTEIKYLLAIQVEDHNLKFLWERDKGPHTPDKMELIAGMKQRMDELPSKMQAAIDKLLSNGTRKFAITDRR